MNFRSIIFQIFLFSLVTGCSPADLDEGISDDSSDGFKDVWLIQKENIIDGGPGKDGILSIDQPVFIASNVVDYLEEEDLVIAMKIGSEIRVYPHKILNWHELVNDGNEDRRWVVTYAPLTGSSVAWNRSINGRDTEFGSSGLLYFNNLIAYDRRTDSHWSQMSMECVNGRYIGIQIDQFPLIETKWSTISSMENVKVLSTVTGHNKNYFLNPFGNYSTNNDFFFFPTVITDNRFQNKDRVLNVFVNDGIKSYAIKKFDDSDIKIIQESFNGESLVIVGSADKNFAVAFLNEDELIFSSSGVNNPGIMKDQFGNAYNIFGNVIDGPALGQTLQPARFYISYWFAISSFYNRITIY